MSPATGRVMALDLGDARIGVAVSDAVGITAQSREPIPSTGARRDVARVSEVAEREGVGTVVVGLPLLLSGEEGSGASKARAFAGRLRDRLPGVRVELWDERLTSAEAGRALAAAGVGRRRRREVVDGMAAALILQSFLDGSASRAGEGEA